MTFTADPHDLVSVPVPSPRTLPVLISLALHALAGLLLWQVEIDRPALAPPVAPGLPVRIRLVTPDVPLSDSAPHSDSPAETTGISPEPAPTTRPTRIESPALRPREPAVSVPAVPDALSDEPPVPVIPPVDHTRTALGLRRLIDDLFTDAGSPDWDCTPEQRRNDLLDCGDDTNGDFAAAVRNPTYDALTATARSATSRRASEDRQSRLAEALGSTGTDGVTVDTVMRALNPAAQERHTATEARTSQLQGQMLQHDVADQLRRRILNAP